MISAPPSNRAIWALMTTALCLLALGSPVACAQNYGAATPADDRQKLTLVYRLYDEYRRQFPEICEISVKQARATAAASKPILFVDVRGSAEQEISMLPGAIDKKQFIEDYHRYRDHLVVVYCTISYRSGLFAKKMAARGITVCNLRGGLLAWILEGGLITDARGVTNRVHVFGETWDLAPDGYQTITYPWWRRLF
ncbi:MAG TPA: rhodanese-like domain-containing protein [Desulfofustis sp.]|jgi:rhodanese-related sulfurtransferase|nr:rhodanese-like domain-containing protein [Desulfofustis sp. PB-SRB1]HBH32781.1 rhodanese-like domain-containing protein [Desulfofustis sp.]